MRVPIPEINGPFVLVNFLHKPRHEEQTEVINYHKAVFHISKYQGQRFGPFCSQEDKKMKKYGNDLHKVIERLALENVCGEAGCEACGVLRENFKIMKETSKRTGVDPDEILETSEMEEHMMKLCEKQGVDYAAFMKGLRNEMEKHAAENPDDPDVREYMKQKAAVSVDDRE